MARIIYYAYSSVTFFLILELCICIDTCVKESPCLCKFSNEKVIDISHLSTGYEATSGNITYYFNGCKNAKVPNAVDTSLALFNKTDNKATDLGNSSVIHYGISQANPLTYELVYVNNNITSRVVLVCSPELTGTFLFVSPKPEEKTNHSLILVSPSACKITQKNGLSTGSTLVVLFIVGCFIYFIGGALILRFMRGARGTEMIPNIDFWRDLPNLVKDGLIFILNGCRPTAVATAESYDRI